MKLIRSAAVHETIINTKIEKTTKENLIQAISDIPTINLSRVILKDQIDDMIKEIESKTKYYEGLLIEVTAKVAAYAEVLEIIKKYTEEEIEE